MDAKCAARLLLILLALSPACRARADTLRLINGRVYEGEVMIEGRHNIVFRTDNTYMTVDRKEIESLVRSAAPPPAAPAEPTGPQPTKALFTAMIYVPQGPLENLLVRVGPGGVTREEFKRYLGAEAAAAGKPGQELTAQERQRALQKAVDDEVLFQGALAAGFHSHEPIRRMIIARYRARFTSDLVKPEHFTEEDRRAFYEANKESLRTPPRVRLKVRAFTPDVPRKEVDDAWRAASTNPTAVIGWKDFGWVASETEKETLSRQDVAYLLTLGTGEVSKVIMDLYGGAYFFWVAEREEGEPPSYDTMRDAVLQRMMADRVLELEAKFDREVQETCGGRPLEEVLFQRALEAGVHREAAVREQMIDLYLSSRKVPRDALLAELRKTFPVSRAQED